MTCISHWKFIREKTKKVNTFNVQWDIESALFTVMAQSCTLCVSSFVFDPSRDVRIFDLVFVIRDYSGYIAENLLQNITESKK